MIGAAGGDYIAQGDLVAGQGRWDAASAAAGGDGAVALAHRAGYPSEPEAVGQGAESGYDAAAAAAGLGAGIIRPCAGAGFGGLMFYRAAVADQDQGAARKDAGAQLPDVRLVGVIGVVVRFARRAGVQHSPPVDCGKGVRGLATGGTPPP